MTRWKQRCDMCCGCISSCTFARCRDFHQVKFVVFQREIKDDQSRAQWMSSGGFEHGKTDIWMFW